MKAKSLLSKPSRLLLATLSLGLLLAFPAQGQFSGPALSVPAQPNGVQTPTTDLRLLNPAQGDVTLEPGDEIAVNLFGVTTFAPAVRVGEDGNVQLPLIGAVHVAGLTTTQAASLIAARLIDAKMYVNPQVSIQVAQSAGQFATVSGVLHGIVPVNGSRRLLDVLAAAGSLPPNASHVVTILRPGVKQPIVVDLGTDPLRSAQANVAILPRDTIIISQVGVVYVLGAFKKTGIIPLEQTSPLTLLQATALSDGPLLQGKFDDLRIIRTDGLDRRFVKVDIKKVLSGRAPDPILQADDIVYLPSSTWKSLFANGSIGSLTGIVSLVLVALRQ